MNPTDNLLVISYNEGEQDFDQAEIIKFCELVKTKNPSCIILCTQKSKSQVAIALPTKIFSKSDSTKHFPHVFGNYLLLNEYTLLHKKDGSFPIIGITENNNVRTRIYTKVKENNIKFIFNKLSETTIGQISKMSLNRQAIYTHINYFEKDIIIINTELADYNNGNLGVSDRQKEFMGLIKEFELHKKYSDGCNIIFCGSLNFKLNPIKMVNYVYNSALYSALKKYIEVTPENNLIQYNELKIYLDKLINEINIKKINSATENSIKEIITSQPYNNIKKNNNLYVSLLFNFSESIKTSHIKLTCDPQFKSKTVFNPLKVGSVIGHVTTAVNSGLSGLKETNPTTSRPVYGAGYGTGFYRTAESLGRSVSSQVITQPIDISVKKYKLPSMCDRILFALHPRKYKKYTDASSSDNSSYKSDEKELYFIDSEVYTKLEKSKHRIVYSTFSTKKPEFTENNRNVV